MSFAETCRENLLVLARTYAAAADVPLSTVSKRAYGNGNFFDELAAGGNPTIIKVESVFRWFAANWPPKIRWPSLTPLPMPRGRAK